MHWLSPLPLPWVRWMRQSRVPGTLRVPMPFPIRLRHLLKWRGVHGVRQIRRCRHTSNMRFACQSKAAVFILTIRKSTALNAEIANPQTGQSVGNAVERSRMKNNLFCQATSIGCGFFMPTSSNTSGKDLEIRSIPYSERNRPIIVWKEVYHGKN